MLSPIANGIKPITVVIAVSVTGRNLVRPPRTSDSNRLSPSRSLRIPM